MGISKVIAGGVLVGLGILQAGCGGNTNTIKHAGAIKVVEAQTQHSCSIPADPGTGSKDYDITKYGCTNDQAYYTRFDNVDSALTITYFDDKKNGACEDNAGWEIEVLTIKQPTTAPTPGDPSNLDTYIGIADMAGYVDGSIIKPGVKKVRYLKGDKIQGHLSCIRVERK